MRTRRDTRPSDGEQLRLDLFAGKPWDGRDPRGLTRIQIELSLRREPGGREVEVDPLQLEMWPVSVKAAMREPRRPAVGAPLLLPLGPFSKKSRTGRWRLHGG